MPNGRRVGEYKRGRSTAGVTRDGGRRWRREMASPAKGRRVGAFERSFRALETLYTWARVSAPNLRSRGGASSTSESGCLFPLKFPHWNEQYITALVGRRGCPTHTRGRAAQDCCRGRRRRHTMDRLPRATLAPSNYCLHGEKKTIYSLTVCLS